MAPRLAPPKQPRSQRTLERIVAAGLALLEEKGPAGVTVQAVVKRARSSVGSFYARFRGKEDLLAYLAEHVRESALTEWRASVDAPLPSAALLPEAVTAAVDHVLEVRRRWDAGVKAAAGLADRSSDYDAFRDGIVEELSARLLERRAEIAHPSPDVAVRIGLWAILGVVDHETAAHLDPQLDAQLGPDSLRGECVALLLAYLTGGSRAGGGQVEFFDVWS